MRTILGLWRWRRNPLRRNTDLAEAWAALTAVGLFAVAAPAVGWLCGNVVHGALRETVRFQHEHRHRTTAVVVGGSTVRHVVPFDAESTAESDVSRWVTATWRAVDGSSHTGSVPAPSRKSQPGDTFGMWADERGRPVKPPMNADGALTHAVLAGVGAGGLAVGLVEGGRRLFVWHLVQRRYEHLDQAWAKAGPDWGRMGAGS